MYPQEQFGIQEKHNIVQHNSNISNYVFKRLMFLERVSQKSLLVNPLYFAYFSAFVQFYQKLFVSPELIVWCGHFEVKILSEIWRWLLTKSARHDLLYFCTYSI